MLGINLSLKNRRFVIIAIAMVICISVLGFLVLGLNKPISVKTVVIEKVDFEDYHLEESTVNAKDSINVYSDGSGNIVDLLVREGSLIKKGEVVLKIDDEDLLFELKLLQAQKDSLLAQKKSDGSSVKEADIKLQKEAIQIAKNKVASSAIELDRKKKLFNSGGISKKNYEAEERLHKESISNLNIEEFKLSTLEEGIKQGVDKDKYYDTQISKLDLQIRNIEEKIEAMNVVAPIDGIISELEVVKGDLVRANQQLFKIFNPDLYEIESYVLAKEVKSLNVGMDVTIELEDNTSIKQVNGSISYIAPNAVEIVSPLGLTEKKVKVVIDPVGKSEFILGEEVDVRFVTYHKEGARLISKDYIFPMDKGEAVWIVVDGKAQLMMVDTDYDTSASIVLKNKVDGDMRIIMPPFSDKIQEGMEVRID